MSDSSRKTSSGSPTPQEIDRDNASLDSSKKQTPQGGKAEREAEDGLTQLFINAIKFLSKMFKGGTPYSQSPQSQAIMKDTIDSLDESSKNYKDQGNITEAYLMQREKAYMEAIHETALSSDFKENNVNSLAEQSKALAEEKIKDLDESELGQLARNEYVNDMSESSLAAIHSDITNEVMPMYAENFDEKTLGAISQVRANDLNDIIEKQAEPPLTPNEKQNGVENDVSHEVGAGKDQDLSHSSERDMSSPSSGPGR